MSKKLFLQFQDNNSEQLFWFYLDDDQIKDSGEESFESLTELTERFATKSIVVLVPSVDCHVSTVNLPTKVRRQQLKAMPFALEEQLATDIDTMHFAIGNRREDGQLPVIAVTRQKMDYWLQILSNAGISPIALLPECALIEAPENAWSIFQLNDRFFINQNGNCWSATADSANLMLQLSIQQLNDEQQPPLLYWGDEQAPEWIAGLGLEYSSHAIQEPQQALLTRFDTQKINLLQGDYIAQDDWQEGWKVWRQVAIFALITILLKFLTMGFDVYRLNEQQDYLKTEVARTYHQVAPGARITAYPERQMRQLLSQKQAGKNQSNSFLMMLNQVSEGLATIPDIKPTNINYDNNKGELRLDLLISSLPLLDKLKEQLVNKGLSIEVGAANSQGNSYSGRLIIRSGS